MFSSSCITPLTDQRKLNPPIESSISKIGEHKWLVGRQHICEPADSSNLTGAIAHWDDELGRKFCLRTTDAQPQSSYLEPFYCAGDCAALWQFAGKIWKVKSSLEKMQMEAETIDFVKSHFSGIPVPTVVHYWNDTTDRRSFMVLDREKGQTLDSCWASLTDPQQEAIAKTVAGYVERLATSQRPSMETVSGYGIDNPTLQPRTKYDPLYPSLLRLTSLKEANDYFSPLKVESSFVFSHCDLAACNILIDENGSVTCLIDWEAAGYVPRWYVYLQTRRWSMMLSDERFEKAWMELIGQALKEKGFDGDRDTYRRWHSGGGAEGA